MSDFSLLDQLGWQSFFQQQLSLEEWEFSHPARVIEQHRSELWLVSCSGEHRLPIIHSMPDIVVGDWLLLDHDWHYERLLERKTCFQRKAAGTEVKYQLISANIDTAFIVCSMNEDFNLNRIERYLSLVNEAQVEPVIVLTKSDLSTSPEEFMDLATRHNPTISIEAINGLSTESVSKLAPWLTKGKTVCVLGSSGVGKSTLVNTLLGEEKQETKGIREDDAKGRHTTTRRSLISLKSGALILDTPGMREIQLTDCKAGIETTFSDIQQLASQCRYHDCQHKQEPGCSVRRAVEAGILDERRLENYLKLLQEEAFNSASMMERRAKDKSLGKFYKRTLAESQKLKGR